MPTAPARTADDLADNIRSLIDRLVDARFTKAMGERAGDVAELIADRGADMGERASEAWRDSRPARRRAAKQLSRASRDAARWSERAWRRSVRPALKDLWKQRAIAIGAAGAAVPAGREIVDQAAVRMGLKEREARHWGAFFLGLLLGAIGGAVAALLLAPKPGSEMRRDLTARATEMADEIATRARETEWVPLFERDEITSTNGGVTATGEAPIGGSAIADTPVAPAEATEETRAAVESATEATSDEEAVAESSIDRAGDEAAEAINEAFETTPPTEEVEREQA